MELMTPIGSFITHMRHIFSAKKNLSHFTATDFLLYYNLFWSSLLGSLIYTTAGRLFCFALSSITLPLEKTPRVSSSYLQADPDPRLASTDVSPSIPYSWKDNSRDSFLRLPAVTKEMVPRDLPL